MKETSVIVCLIVVEFIKRELKLLAFSAFVGLILFRIFYVYSESIFSAVFTLYALVLRALNHLQYIYSNSSVDAKLVLYTAIGGAIFQLFMYNKRKR